MVKLTIPFGDGRVMVYEGSEDEIMKIGASFEQGARPVVAPARVDIVVWTKGAASTFVGLIYGDQAKLINFLVKRGGVARYSEVETHMGYKGQQLGGVLSALTRNAKKATGMDSARIVDWRLVKSGGYEFEYYVDPKALPFLTELLK